MISWEMDEKSFWPIFLCLSNILSLCDALASFGFVKNINKRRTKQWKIANTIQFDNFFPLYCVFFILFCFLFSPRSLFGLFIRVCVSLISKCLIIVLCLYSFASRWAIKVLYVPLVHVMHKIRSTEMLLLSTKARSLSFAFVRMLFSISIDNFVELGSSLLFRYTSAGCAVHVCIFNDYGVFLVWESTNERCVCVQQIMYKYWSEKLFDRNVGKYKWHFFKLQCIYFRYLSNNKKEKKTKRDEITICHDGALIFSSPFTHSGDLNHFSGVFFDFISFVLFSRFSPFAIPYGSHNSFNSYLNFVAVHSFIRYIMIYCAIVVL